MTATHPDIFDAIAEAEAARDKGYAQLDAADSFDENALLREQILVLGQYLDVFSANDLPEKLRKVTNPNRRGRMFAQLAGEGLIAEVGMVKSSNVKAHGKRVLTYRLVTS